MLIHQGARTPERARTDAFREYARRVAGDWRLFQGDHARGAFDFAHGPS